MKKGSSAKSSDHRTRKKLIYVKSAAEVPDFKSEDEVAAWYQTHSTVLIQDQLETLPARVGGEFASAPRRPPGHGEPAAPRPASHPLCPIHIASIADSRQLTAGALSMLLRTVNCEL